jgi:Ca2+/Na+ antiporter
MSKQSNRMDLCFLGILTFFFALFFVMSFFLSRIAGTVPKLISGIALILCLIVLLKVYLDKKRCQEEKEEEKQTESGQGIPVFKTLLILVVYSISLLILGFPLSTFIVLALWPVMLGNKNYLKNIIFSLISTGVFYWIFVKLFFIRLPIGILVESILK